MIGEHEVAFYREQGYLVVEGVLGADEIIELRRVTDEMVAAARGLTGHTEVYDLEPDHAPDRPRVRRIKQPHLRHEAYRRLVGHPNVVAALRPLIGEAIRFDVSKLNMKEAGGGAAVEWHQDWAFYPHTNDDLCAVGFMMDDCGPENGPLLIVPGTHRGPIHDHHGGDGRFCGAIDPDRADVDFAAAVPLTGPAGSITVHHARVIHGSAPNRSGRPRRLLLHQYRAADAWPLLGLQRGMDWAAYNDLLIAGEPSLEPRMERVPVRLPLPPADHQGSIYENQRALGRRYFAEEAAAAAM